MFKSITEKEKKPRIKKEIAETYKLYKLNMNFQSNIRLVLHIKVVLH